MSYLHNYTTRLGESKRRLLLVPVAKYKQGRSRSKKIEKLTAKKFGDLSSAKIEGQNYSTLKHAAKLYHCKDILTEPLAIFLYMHSLEYLIL